MTAAVAGAASRTAATGAARTGGAAAATRTAPAAAPASAPATTSSTPKAAPAPAAPRRRRLPALPRLGGGGESVGQSMAGLILGFLFWGWVILPLVRGGPEEVRDTLRAKFLNKDQDGRWLP